MPENKIVVVAVDPEFDREFIHASALGPGVLCDVFRKPIPVDGMERRQRADRWYPSDHWAEVDCIECVDQIRWIGRAA